MVIVDALRDANVSFCRLQGFELVPGTAHNLYPPATTLLKVDLRK